MVTKSKSSSVWRLGVKLLLALLPAMASMVVVVRSASPDLDGWYYWVMVDQDGERAVISTENGSQDPGPHRSSPGIWSALDNATSPIIEASAEYDWIYSWGWATNATIYACVHSGGFTAEPQNPGNCDLYHNSMSADSFGSVYFELDGALDLQGHHYISMGDTLMNKFHQVTNLIVTGANALADTVSGTADAGTFVQVTHYSSNSTVDVGADGYGDWTANFNGTADLIPGSSGDATQTDADGDYTIDFWSVPQPWILAEPGYDSISGLEFPVGNTVHVCVTSSGYAADPTVPGQCDLFYDSAVVPAPDPGFLSQVSFNLSGMHDLQAGEYIAMTDEATTKLHRVKNLAVTGGDAALDTVFGTTDPGMYVSVYKFDCASCFVAAIADGSGNWVADFSTIGEDLHLGDNGYASQHDADDDRTQVYWTLPDPHFTARPDGDLVFAQEWPTSAQVHLCISDSGYAADPTDPLQCDLFYENAIIPPPGGSGRTFYLFNVGSTYDLVAGDYIAMTDTTMTKQHTVTSLDVTSIDTGNDIVSGTAAPFTDVEVSVSNPAYVIKNVSADSSGDWQADFSLDVDIDIGANGSAKQVDADGDGTDDTWSLFPPTIDAYPLDDVMDGYNWPDGSTVHLCINSTGFASDATIPAQCSLYHDSDLSATLPSDEDTTLVEFDLNGIFDLQAGQYASMSDGLTQKDLLVADLSVTGWDVSLDTLEGTADPNEDVFVIVSDCMGCYRNVTADGSGNWTADFSGVADLVPGDTIFLIQSDPDDDNTYVEWMIPEYDLFLPLIQR